MSEIDILKLQNQFDILVRHIPETDIEFWFARDLQAPLGCGRWENFLTAVKRAIKSCITTGYEANDHFRSVTKMITLGKGGQREIDDFMLTRYACYLIAQVGTKFRRQILNPLLEDGLVEMTCPKKPTSSKQIYRIADKGIQVLQNTIELYHA